MSRPPLRAVRGFPAFSCFGNVHERKWARSHLKVTRGQKIGSSFTHPVPVSPLVEHRRRISWMTSALSATTATTVVVLGKRKTRSTDDHLSLRLDYSTTEHEHQTESEYDTDSIQPHASTSAGPKRRERRYKCSHEGCLKAYTKPSRLAEHERSHTGDVCAAVTPLVHVL